MNRMTSIPVVSLEEWLAVWEAVSMFIDNAAIGGELDDRSRAARDAAIVVLDRMDEAFIRATEHDYEGRVLS